MAYKVFFGGVPENRHWSQNGQEIRDFTGYSLTGTVQAVRLVGQLAPG
jgi:hypothetical protein